MAAGVRGKREGGTHSGQLLARHNTRRKQSRAGHENQVLSVGKAATYRWPKALGRACDLHCHREQPRGAVRRRIRQEGAGRSGLSIVQRDKRKRVEGRRGVVEMVVVGEVVVVTRGRSVWRSMLEPCKAPPQAVHQRNLNRGGIWPNKLRSCGVGACVETLTCASIFAAGHRKLRELPLCPEIYSSLSASHVFPSWRAQLRIARRYARCAPQTPKRPEASQAGTRGQLPCEMHVKCGV